MSPAADMGRALIGLVGLALLASCDGEGARAHAQGLAASALETAEAQGKSVDAPPITTRLCEPLEVPPPERKGRYVRWASLGAPGLQPRVVRVLLPKDYDRTTRRYPVLYVHDGQFAFEGGMRVDEAVDGLVSRKAIEPHIVVAVDRTAQRSKELKPLNRRGRSHLDELRRRGVDPSRPSLELYADFLVNVVKPLVDCTLRTRADRESNAVVGYSLGGLANMYFLIHYPGVFGRVGCMSPSLWWGDRIALTSFERFRGSLPDRLWIDAGTKEGKRWEDIPYFIADIRRARDLAIRKGMRLGRDLGYLEHPGAPHADWAAAQRMPAALWFLLRPREVHDSSATGLSVHVFNNPLRRRLSSNLAVTLEYGDLTQVTWSNPHVSLRSSDERIVRVDPDGRVRPLRRGIAWIEARAQGLYGSALVYVR